MKSILGDHCTVSLLAGYFDNGSRTCIPNVYYVAFVVDHHVLVGELDAHRRDVLQRQPFFLDSVIVT